MVFVSLLSGTYICTFSQKYLESSANVTIEVISLPLKQNILIDPIAASIQCEVQQTLECCISANTMEDYTVTFVVQQNESQVGKKQQTCRISSCTMCHNPGPGFLCFQLGPCNQFILTAIMTTHKYS